jgi:lysophospholipase L1-like esterase
MRNARESGKRVPSSLQHSFTFPRGIAGLMLCAIVAARCASNPAAPAAPSPVLTCPAAQSLQSADGQPVAIAYAPPAIVGGTAPITIACTPISGSMFPVGLTPVMCRAVDAAVRASSCQFDVMVAPPPPPPTPRLSVTRFVAFGDSITEGTISLIPSPPQSYPFKLQNLLVARYTDQIPAIRVLDEGIGGERVDAGLARLGAVLAADSPDVLLLVEGVNDLNSGGAAAMPAILNALRTMVRFARGRGIQVFVGTLLPQRPGASRAFAVGLIEPMNGQIRTMAAAEGAVLVDLYEGFGGSPDPWVGSDGLHPTEAGMGRIAELFFNTVRERLETAPVRTLRFRR